MSGKHKQTCSIAGFLNIFGDAWTLLIVREAFYGTTRFSDFQRHTGAAKNLLSDRLSNLVNQGILEKVNVGTTGARYAYHVTAKGESLKPLLAAIIVWSNENLYTSGEEPTLVLSRDTGEPVRSFEMTFDTKAAIPVPALDVVAGPGANDAARKRLANRPWPAQQMSNDPKA
ncbi:helix-turn-helix transcriptional regulator [Shimia sp. R11_0]|uniref:winged helix-turn-helix transcriptional regulator n=1 Tax=Shimia sp. R11_0 TaxID=2821096 RepID=UPI001ADA7655|nr:helix-turn-helix domain-containing protein [Shimia sp. R11_0]MBO9479608.1 helix-turn-helix transcriptional regulator [Shimia sp. R11_0]